MAGVGNYFIWGHIEKAGLSGGPYLLF